MYMPAKEARLGTCISYEMDNKLADYAKFYGMKKNQYVKMVLQKHIELEETELIPKRLVQNMKGENN